LSILEESSVLNSPPESPTRSPTTREGGAKGAKDAKDAKQLDDFPEEKENASPTANGPPPSPSPGTGRQESPVEGGQTTEQGKIQARDQTQEATSGGSQQSPAEGTVATTASTTVFVAAGSPQKGAQSKKNNIDKDQLKHHSSAQLMKSPAKKLTPHKRRARMVRLQKEQEARERREMRLEEGREQQHVQEEEQEARERREMRRADTREQQQRADKLVVQHDQAAELMRPKKGHGQGTTDQMQEEQKEELVQQHGHDRSEEQKEALEKEREQIEARDRRQVLIKHKTLTLEPKNAKQQLAASRDSREHHPHQRRGQQRDEQRGQTQQTKPKKQQPGPKQKPSHEEAPQPRLQPRTTDEALIAAWMTTSTPPLPPKKKNTKRGGEWFPSVPIDPDLYKYCLLSCRFLHQEQS
jgi:hypothetical protein